MANNDDADRPESPRDLTPEQRYRHIVVSSLHNWFDEDPANHWTPHPSQQLVLEAIFRNDCKLVFCQCGRKWGKCLESLTKIPTPDRGFVEIGKLKEGDFVFDENGKKTKVIGVFHHFKENMFQIRFSDGETVDASGDHRWVVSTRNDKRSKRKQQTLRTDELVDVFAKNGKSKTFNYSIRRAPPLELPKKDLPIHPYALGLWLGDGKSTQFRITSADPETKKKLESLGFEVVQEKQKYQLYVKGVRSKLAKLNLLNNKHVPDEYLWGSVSQRTELLQGLMDSDGWCQREKGQCCFQNKNKFIADAVVHLVRSLGMKCSIHTRQTSCNGKDFGVAHVVCFYANHINPFSLKRKAERVKTRRRTLDHVIVSVEKAPSAQCTCIAVDNSSHLYLCGKSFIPTHNTEVIVYSLWRWALLNPGQSCYYICPEFKQAKEIVWKSRDRKGRLRIQEFGPNDFIESIDNTELRINFKNGSFIKIDGSDNFDSWAGISPHFVVLDEFRSFKPQFYGVMNPNRATFNAPQVIIGTPPELIWLDKDTPHQYVEIAHEAQLDMLETGNSFHIKRPSWDNPDPMIQSFLGTEKKRLMRLGKLAEWWREYGAELVSGGESKVFPRFIADPTVSGAHVYPHSHILDAMYH